MVFIKSAFLGMVFFKSQQPRAFVAYDFEFEPGPGYVLLDATADLNNMSALLPGVVRCPVPKPSYEQLEVYHVPLPRKEFAKPRAMFSKRRTAVEYGDWIQSVVRQNSSPGDKVLVVAHKAVFDQDLFGDICGSEFIDWGGIQVKTLHWGAGIGQNKYKDCDDVYLFGEFYLPKYVVLAETLAARRLRADRADLARANAPWSSQDPTTRLYAEVLEGHLLRWTKQLGARTGPCRTFDDDGHCGKGRVFTTMRLERLIENKDRLWPGSPDLKISSVPYEPDGLSLKAQLLEFLLHQGLDCLSFKEIGQMIGVSARAIRQSLKRSPELVANLRCLGWEVKRSSDKGLPGNMKILCRT